MALWRRESLRGLPLVCDAYRLRSAALDLSLLSGDVLTIAGDWNCDTSPWIIRSSKPGLLGGL